MEPNQPPVQEFIKNTPEVVIPKTKPNWTIVVFVVSIILSLGIAILLFFQNQQLKKQAVNQQVSPTLILSPTPKTVSSISIPPDEMVGWKTYTNTEYFYSFKYPKNLILKNIADGADGSLPTNAIMLTLSDPTRPNYEDRLIDIQYLDLLLDVTPKSDWYSTIVKLGDTQAIKFISNKPEVKFDVYHVNIKSGGLEIMTNKTQSTILIDQILSTFKFVDQIDKISCTNDSDCGVNICDCKADLEKNILVKDKICTRYCPGIPKCISSKCILTK